MKRTGLYPGVRTRSGSSAVVTQAGGVLLVQTVRKSGLDAALSAALAPWRKPRAVHDPGKTLLDVALSVALGGDCLADVAMLRAEPGMFGPVASDPTVSRLVETLATAGRRPWPQSARPATPALRNLPLHTSAQNQIWLEIVQLALDLLAWMPILALTGDARRWEIKKLRLRLFSTAARLTRSGRQHTLRFAGHWPWTHVLLAAHDRLALLPNPG